MVVKSSRQFLYGAATMVIIMALGVGVLNFFVGVNPQDSGSQQKISPRAASPNPVGKFKWKFKNIYTSWCK